MNWIATNIRFPEDQYMKLKMKAAKERKSVAAVIREAASLVAESENQDQISKDKQRAEKLIADFRKLAKSNAKYVKKGFDFTKALREMRYQQ